MKTQEPTPESKTATGTIAAGMSTEQLIEEYMLIRAFTDATKGLQSLPQGAECRCSAIIGELAERFAKGWIATGDHAAISPSW